MCEDHTFREVGDMTINVRKSGCPHSFFEVVAMGSISMSEDETVELIYSLAEESVWRAS